MDVEDKKDQDFDLPVVKTADCLKPERLSFSGLEWEIKIPFLLRVH